MDYSKAEFFAEDSQSSASRLVISQSQSQPRVSGRVECSANSASGSQCSGSVQQNEDTEVLFESEEIVVSILITFFS